MHPTANEIKNFISVTLSKVYKEISFSLTLQSNASFNSYKSMKNLLISSSLDFKLLKSSLNSEFKLLNISSKFFIVVTLFEINQFDLKS